MTQRRDEGRKPHPCRPSQPAGEAAPRKPYVPPALVEYGTIAKLTQGSQTRSNDGSNTRKLMSCL